MRSGCVVARRSRAEARGRPRTRARAPALRLTLVRSVSIRPGQQRRAHHVELARRSDSATRIGRRRRRGSSAASVADDDEAERDDLLVVARRRARAERDARALRLRDRAACAGRARAGVGRNVVVAVDARDLLDEVFLDREVEAIATAASRRNRRRRARTRSRAARRRRRSSSSASGDAEQPRDARRPHAHRIARAAARRVASVSGPALPPQISRISCVARSTRARAAVEIDAALEAIAGVAREAEAAHLALDHRGIPERAFEIHARRVVGDARVLAAHDAGEPERLRLVGRPAAGPASSVERLPVQQLRASRRLARSARRSPPSSSRSS